MKRCRATHEHVRAVRTGEVRAEEVPELAGQTRSPMLPAFPQEVAWHRGSFHRREDYTEFGIDSRADPPHENPRSARIGETGSSPKLLNRMRRELRLWHYAVRIEEVNIKWITAFLKFHWDRWVTWQHPSELGGSAVNT